MVVLTPTTFESEGYMDSMKIEDYINELNVFCANCNARFRCKDRTKLCFRKKLIFRISKHEYQRRVKKGEIK